MATAQQLADQSTVQMQQAQGTLDQLLAGQSLATLRSQWQSGQQQLITWQQLETQATQLRQAAAQELQQQAAIVQLDNQLSAQQVQLQTLRQHYKLLKQQVEDKRALLLQEQKIQSLEALRTQLQPDEACPLCGSHQHPAVATYQSLDLSLTQAALAEAERARDLAENVGQQAGMLDLTYSPQHDLIDIQENLDNLVHQLQLDPLPNRSTAVLLASISYKLSYVRQSLMVL